jgi:hypothetical protein
MSTQAYTNKRRVLAEAGNRKVQYPGRKAINVNPIYATINCSANFQPLTYKDICGCSFTNRGIPKPEPPPIPPEPPVYTDLDGQDANTGVGDVDLWIDGGNAGTGTGDVELWFDCGSN